MASPSVTRSFVGLLEVPAEFQGGLLLRRPGPRARRPQGREGLDERPLPPNPDEDLIPELRLFVLRWWMEAMTTFFLQFWEPPTPRSQGPRRS